MTKKNPDNLSIIGVSKYLIVISGYRNPLAFASFMQAANPFLLILRIPAADTFSVTQLSSSGL